MLIRDDKRFHREGSDLVTVLEVPATSAMLGATLPIETLTGERDVELEAGAQHGDSIRLRGEGLPSLRNPGRRGDLHVAIKVVTPVKLNDEQRDLVERLDAGDTDAEWIAELCLLKNHATQTMQWCADAAVQILGGMGYMRGTKSERLYREVKVMMIGGGAEEIMKELAARQLGV